VTATTVPGCPPLTIDPERLDIAGLVRRSLVPVLVERPAPVRSTAGDVLVVSDGTIASRDVVTAAGAFVSGQPTRPLLLFTGRRSPTARRELAEQATMLRETTTTDPIVLGVRYGDAREILQVARELRVTMIVAVASTLGADIARRADCSVLIVPSSATAPAGAVM
jgi:nucleotide-binding universal stress UspA family protein